MPEKAHAMTRRVSPLLNLFRRPASTDDAVPKVHCRHCGSPKLKLSYRRRDRAAHASADGGTQTVFILRCTACEGFTTVNG